MNVSGPLLVLTLVSLLAACSCLPAECTIHRPLGGTSKVDCNYLNLLAIPDGIPSNAGQFTARFNNIRNVTYLPPLPRLRWLDLGTNSIESFSWMSLRALPVLKFLFLNRNRLRYVQLDKVIEHLPKLETVDVSYNKLVSLSQYELGWPQVATAHVEGNPFHCDCDLSWLTDSMACLQACKGRGKMSCCLSCSACFLFDNLGKRAVCQSPPRLNGLSLTDVSTHLTGCGADQPTTTTTTSASSVMMETEEAKTTKLRTSEKDTAFEHWHYYNTTTTVNTTETTYSHATVQIKARQTTIFESPRSQTDLNKPEDQEIPIVYISIVALESALSSMFIACIVRLLLMRYRMGRSRREEVSRDHPIPLHQISPPPVPNSACGSTSAEGGEHETQYSVAQNDDQHCEGSGYRRPDETAEARDLYLTPSDVNSQHCEGSGYRRQDASTAACGLYIAPTDVNLENNSAYTAEGLNE